MVAARLANLPLGGAAYRSANLQTDRGISQSDAASMLHVFSATRWEVCKFADLAYSRKPTPHKAPILQICGLVGVSGDQTVCGWLGTSAGHGLLELALRDRG